MKKKVKFFQISTDGDHLFGLDSDGNIWQRLMSEPYTWSKIESPEYETLEEDEENDLQIFPARKTISKKTY